MAEATVSFRKHVLALIGEAYGDKTLVLCPTVFVKLLHGNHKAAILLSQILYWSDRTKDPDGWFFKSYADWTAETGLSEAQVRRIVHGDRRTQQVQLTLHDLGVETKLKKVRSSGAPTVHYRVNQKQFLNALQAFMGQGDTDHLQVSNPANEGDEPVQMDGMNSAECAASLDQDSEITSKDHIQADHGHQNLDEDFDLAICFAYRNRFGKLKETVKLALREQLARLGEQQVQVVLERCSSRGRSWSYVLAALVNEAPTATAQEATADTRWDEFTGFYGDEGQLPSEPPAAASLPVSDHVLTPQKKGTALQMWNAVFDQLTAQLGSDFRNRARGVTLVDFEANVFVVAVKTAFMRDELEGRLARSVQRILTDVAGHGMALQVLLEDEWVGRYSEAGIALSA